MEDDQLFKSVKEKTGVNKKQLFELVNSLQGANLKDEKTVRRLISDVSKAANKPVSKEMEDRLVKTITSNNIPDFSLILQAFGGKK